MAGLPAEVLEQVGELARPEPLEALVVHPEPDLARLVPEGLDRRPVDHPLGRRARAEPGRAEPAEEGVHADVDADQPDPAVDGGEVEVGGPDHLDTVDVDHLVVEDVPGEHHLAGPPDEVAQVDPRAAQDHPGVVELGDEAGVEVDDPAAHPDHEPVDRRVVLVPRDPGDEVDQLADLLAVEQPDRAADQPGEGDDRLPDRADGREPAVALLAA